MAATNRKDVRAALASWQDYRGCTPFGSANSGFAIDRCNEHLSSAGCILSMLAAAAEDAGALLDKGGESQFDNRAGKIMAGALEGVGTLIDLAAFLLEGE